MRLSPITSLRDSKDSQADAIDLAYLTASTIDSSEIGTLRWLNVDRSQIISFTSEKNEKAILQELITPAISTESIDGLGSKIDRTEHLVIRDFDLPQLHPSSNTGQSRIIAHAEYVYCPVDWFKRHRYSPTNPNESLDPRISGGNQPLMDLFMKEIYRISEINTGEKECYMLTALHTLDTHLRKGIASKLVQWIFPFADERRREVFLVASPIGGHVYLKNGYEVVEGEDSVIRIPLEGWGGRVGAIHEMLAMRRLSK